MFFLDLWLILIQSLLSIITNHIRCPMQDADQWVMLTAVSRALVDAAATVAVGVAML